MNVVLLSGDLMSASRIQGAASRIAAKLSVATTAEQAVKFCGDESATLLVVDLATPGLEIGPLVNSLQRGAFAPLKVVAFGPHVHEERLTAALEAGCDEVVSRGQFFSQIDSILGRHAG